MVIVGTRIKVVPSTMIQTRPFLRHLICKYFCLLSRWIGTRAKDHQTLLEALELEYKSRDECEGSYIIRWERGTHH